MSAFILSEGLHNKRIIYLAGTVSVPLSKTRYTLQISPILIIRAIIVLLDVRLSVYSIKVLN